MTQTRTQERIYRKTSAHTTRMDRLTVLHAINRADHHRDRQTHTDRGRHGDIKKEREIFNAWDDGREKPSHVIWLLFLFFLVLRKYQPSTSTYIINIIIQTNQDTSSNSKELVVVKVVSGWWWWWCHRCKLVMEIVIHSFNRS